MEPIDNIWLNPVIELPIGIAVLVLAAILFATFYSLRSAITCLVLTVPLQRFVVIPGIIGNRFTPHEAAFLCCLAAIVVRWRSQVRLSLPWNIPIGVPALGLLTVGVVSLLGNPFADVGISELVILVYLLLLANFISDLAATSELAFHVFKSWYITCAGFCILAMAGGLLQSLGVDTFLMGGPRLIVTFFNPNQAGSFIIAGIFLFLAHASDAKTPMFRKVVDLGLVFCSIGSAYFMQSRATVLGGISGLAVFLVLRRAKVSAIAGIGILFLAGSAALSAFQKSDEDRARIYDNRYSEGVDPDSQSASVRIENWRTGIEAFNRSPVVGIGIGTLWLTSDESYQVHNTYLSFLGETGALGFLLLLIIVFIVVRESVRGMKLARGTPYEDPLVALIPALVALGIFNIFHYGIRARHLWLTIALVLSFRRLAGLAARRARQELPSPTLAPVVPLGAPSKVN